jgi:putative chitinase
MSSLERIICDICPRERVDIVKGVAAELEAVFKHFEINTPLRQAHFLAQAAHETDGFRTLTEYASGDAYDTRTDLGNTKAKDGDGRRNKGRGIFQTTGATNYRRVRDALRKLFGLKAPDSVADPTVLAQPKWAAWSAGIYWNDNKLNALADKDDGRAITKKINGGYNGLNDRLQYLQRAKEALTTGVFTAEPLSRDKIRIVQQKLVALGYKMVGKADGIVGPKTVAAIAAFRFDHGLPASDRIDDELLRALK